MGPTRWRWTTRGRRASGTAAGPGTSTSRCPSAEFAGNLRQIHDGPASAVYLGRFGDKAIAVKKPKLPTKVRGGDVSIASHLFPCAPTRRAVPRPIESSRLHSKCSLQTCVHSSMETSL